MPGERRHARPPIDVAADDRACAARMAVLDHRHRFPRLIASSCRFVTMRALHVVPPVIHSFAEAGARERHIHLFPEILPDVADVEIARLAIKGEAPWIAQSVCPHL